MKETENGMMVEEEEEVVSIVHVYDLLTLSVQYIPDSSPKNNNHLFRTAADT